MNKEESIKHIRKMLGDDLYIKKEILYYTKDNKYGDVPTYVSTFEFDGIKVRMVHETAGYPGSIEWITEIRVSRRHNSSWDNWPEWGFTALNDAELLCKRLNPSWKRLPGNYIQLDGKRGIVLSVPKHYTSGHSEVLWDNGKLDVEVNTHRLDCAEAISESW